MSQLRFITCEKEWSVAINQFDQWDFFHSHEYHLSRIASDDSSPVMIVIEENDLVQFALPMIRRELEGDAFDLISVYGYTGPLVHSLEQLPRQLDFLRTELQRLNCLSLFCRLHPLFHRDVVPNEMVFDAGKTIAIPCGTEEERFAGYRKTTRYEIRKLGRLGAEVTFDDSPESFDAFVDIYYETMRVLDADPFYFFDESFLRSLFQIEGVTTVIGSVRYEGEIISSGLFTSVNDVAQYFLGGARIAHSKLAPQKLLLHHATAWAADQGASLLHLGGGRGSQEDGLFKFKAGFSDMVLPFRLLKMVLNENLYEDYTVRHASNGGVSVNTLVETGFFPAYRAPIDQAVNRK